MNLLAIFFRSCIIKINFWEQGKILSFEFKLFFPRPLIIIKVYKVDHTRFQRRGLKDYHIAIWQSFFSSRLKRNIRKEKWGYRKCISCWIFTTEHVPEISSGEETNDCQKSRISSYPLFCYPWCLKHILGFTLSILYLIWVILYILSVSGFFGSTLSVRSIHSIGYVDNSTRNITSGAAINMRMYFLVDRYMNFCWVLPKERNCWIIWLLE